MIAIAISMLFMSFFIIICSITTFSMEKNLNLNISMIFLKTACNIKLFKICLLFNAIECFTRNNLYFRKENVCVLIDPPFGGRIEPLVNTLHELTKELNNHQKNMGNEKLISTILFMPYFMEPQIKNHISELKMSDYQVYDLFYTINLFSYYEKRFFPNNLCINHKHISISNNFRYLMRTIKTFKTMQKIKTVLQYDFSQIFH